MPYPIAAARRVSASRQRDEASNLALEQTAGSPALAAAAHRGVRRMRGGESSGPCERLTRGRESAGGPVIPSRLGRRLRGTTRCDRGSTLTASATRTGT